MQKIPRGKSRLHFYLVIIITQLIFNKACIYKRLVKCRLKLALVIYISPYSRQIKVQVVPDDVKFRRKRQVSIMLIILITHEELYPCLPSSPNHAGPKPIENRKYN